MLSLEDPLSQGTLPTRGILPIRVPIRGALVVGKGASLVEGSREILAPGMLWFCAIFCMKFFTNSISVVTFLLSLLWLFSKK